MIIDIRALRSGHPSRYIQSHINTQIVFDPRYPHQNVVDSSIPVMCAMPTPGVQPSMLIRSDDAILFENHTYVLKVVEHFPARNMVNQDKWSDTWVERYYIVDVSTTEKRARLFRVMYRHGPGNFTNLVVLAADRKYDKHDPYTNMILWVMDTQLRGALTNGMVPDTYLETLHRTGLCETWFTQHNLIGNLLYLKNTLQEMVGNFAQCRDRPQTYMDLFQSLHQMLVQTPNYNRVPPYDYLTRQHASRSFVPLAELIGIGFEPLIDQSPCPSLYPTPVTNEYVNNIAVFGKYIEAILAYRLTDFDVLATYAAGSEVLRIHMEVGYLVDRYGSPPLTEGVIISDNGMSACDLDMAVVLYKEYRQTPNLPCGLTVRAIRTYDEEMTLTFSLDDGSPPHCFYFDFNSCTLISPDTCINNLSIANGFTMIDDGVRDVDVWN